MNNIVPLRGGSMPSVFASRANLPDMNSATQQGLQAAFAVIGYKGRNWRIKYRGEDELLKDGRGVPIPVLDVVVVGVSPAISKQWYEKRYSEGDQESPDCFSINGATPDPAAPKKQCASCAACPQNIFGSRVTEAGKKAKACQDSRRIAVVPLGDIENESYGGPMMLRVPPMSLSNLAKYGTELTRFGAQPFMVKTQLAFNYDVAYPLIEFTALGWLDEDEAKAVAEALENPLIERMLEHEIVEAPAAGEPSALAGGKPAFFTPVQIDPAKLHAPTPAVDYEAERAAQAANAKAAADALAAHQAAEAAEAAAAQAAAAQAAQAAAAAAQAAAAATPAATPKKRASPFSKQAAAAAPVAQVAAPTAAAPAEPATPPTTVVTAAPTDMEAAIDDLLAS